MEAAQANGPFEHEASTPSMTFSLGALGLAKKPELQGARKAPESLRVT